MTADRPLPQNLDAERAVLGAILLDNTALNIAVEKLKPEDFFLDQNRRVFQHMIVMGETQQAIDLLTLTHHLEQHRELEAAGGAAYLAQLVDGVPRISNVQHYAGLVREKAELRVLAHAGLAIQQTALAPHASAVLVAEQARQVLETAQAPRILNRKTDAPAWPEPLAEEAFYGLAGEFVRTVEPHSEADPAALLAHFLVYFGNIVGPGSHFRVEADRHGANIFAVIVGKTGKGRKGTAGGQARRCMVKADPTWDANCYKSGLASGEGLIWAVRDPMEREDSSERVVRDEGVSDKRLLIAETEFASTLAVMERPGNTLSPVVRQCWDSGQLSSLTKNSPAKASGAHVSIVCHISQDEVLRFLTTTQQANGFANRFLWFLVKRSRQLPEGGNLTREMMEPVDARIAEAVRFVSGVGEMRRDTEANAMWAEVYGALSDDRPGLLGAILSRAEAQVVRLSLIYALLDCSDAIRREHLSAALAVWDFCEDCARHIFGTAIGDPTADALYLAISRSEKGLGRTEMSNLFGRNRPSRDIDRALELLYQHGHIVPLEVKTDKGRPPERWVSSAGATKETK